MKHTLLLTLMLLLGATVAFAQGTPAAPPASTGIVGSYEGTLKQQPVALDVKTVDGKLRGQLKTADKSYELTEGAVNAEGLLSLTFGKDGKLAFTLAGSNGDIVMAATVVEGKLTGEFDYSGQLQGKWVAVRKN